MSMLRILACSIPLVILGASGAGRADEPRAPASDAVLVHLNTGGTWLETGAPGPYNQVCRAPCDVRVPQGWYRVAGDGAPTPSFLLDSDAIVASRGRSPNRDFAGMTMAILGGGLVLWGIAFFVFSGFAEEPQNMYAIGGVMGGVGLGLAIPGGYLLLSNESYVSINGRKVARDGAPPRWSLTPRGITF